jgi:hypothetical protein
MAEPVQLMIVPNEIEAEQIRAMLELEGIEAMHRLTNFGAGAIDAGSSMAGAREILVRPEDLETARALVEGE